MKRYVCAWAPVCALIGLSLALISCGKLESGVDLPAPSATLSSVTSGYEPVVMVVLPGGSGICSGTFISTRAVLTAAHCTQNAGTYTVTGSLGTFSTSTRVNYGGAADVNDTHDISVLIFSTDVVSASQVYGIESSVSSGDTLRLVGYGCSNLSRRTGAGVKRTGTNVVYSLGSYIEFLTPVTNGVGILGADNRAGSCFGDSGGPALDESSGSPKVAGVTHAGGYYGSDILSQYIDLTKSEHRNFLATVATNYSLTISGIN